MSERDNARRNLASKVRRSVSSDIQTPLGEVSERGTGEFLTPTSRCLDIRCNTLWSV